jgi:phosphoribosylaminoimidazole (AIR) synthetase
VAAENEQAILAQLNEAGLKAWNIGTIAEGENEVVFR